MLCGRWDACGEWALLCKLIDVFSVLKIHLCQKYFSVSKDFLQEVT